MASPDWNEDFLDLLDCLATTGAEFLIVGAFALAQHGLPRATGDLDVLVRPSRENAAKVYEALLKFGAPVRDANVSAEDFTRPGTVYQIGVVPRRIDVLTEISGASFDEAWASRLQRVVDGRPLSFLGRDTLVLNKTASGRTKDLADVEALNKLRR
jgi:hypothetical protein